MKDQKNIERRVDIVLDGGGNGKDIWVEVKSLKRPAQESRYRPWRMSRDSGTSYHRQLFLDRSASVDKRPYIEDLPLAADIQWRLQKFKKKTIESYKSADLERARGWLHKLPSDKSRALPSLGYESATENTKNKSKIYRKVQMQSIKTWVLDKAKDYLLGGIEQDVIDEAIVGFDLLE